MMKENVFKFGLLVCTLTLALSLGCFLDDDSSDDAADTTPPTVTSTSPDGTSPVAIDTTISVIFSEAMMVSSINAVNSTTCGGTIQLSGSDFVGCTPLNTTISPTNGDKTFTVTTTKNLAASTTYKIKITTDVKDAAGNKLATEKIVSFTTQ